MNCIVLFLILCPNVLVAQFYFRIRADFSIKSKTHDGKKMLSLGTVYYDKNSKILVYQFRFPEKQTLATIDTNLYVIENNRIVNKKSIIAINEFSIFHLLLNGILADYGLSKSHFKIDKVEKDKDLIITTWLPPVELQNKIGKILISNKEKKLHGIIFFNSKNKIISKQFYSNYTDSYGLAFPMQIINITYENGKENYEMTTYSNVIINELKNEIIYNYSIPAN